MKTTANTGKMVEVIRYTGSKQTKEQAATVASAMCEQDGALFYKVRRIETASGDVAFVPVVYFASAGVDVATLGDGFDAWLMPKDDVVAGIKARTATVKRSATRARNEAHKAEVRRTWN